MLMALALLLALALVTYSRADDGLARAFSLRDALDPSGASTENALGLVGATLAYGLVPRFLGYPVVLLAGLVGMWGYIFFRHRTTVFLPILSLLAVVLVVLASTFFGWFADSAGTTLALWSGDVGRGVAGWLTQVFGAVGSLILLVLAAIVALLLIVDRDIQITLDRAEASVASLRSTAGEKWGAVRAASAECKEARAARTAERRTEREAKQREKMKQAKGREDKQAEREAKEKPEKRAPVPVLPVAEDPAAGRAAGAETPSLPTSYP